MQQGLSKVREANRSGLFLNTLNQLDQRFMRHLFLPDNGHTAEEGGVQLGEVRICTLDHGPSHIAYRKLFLSCSLFTLNCRILP